MRRKNIQKLLLWIVIPASASFLAGVWFTLRGVTNLGITIIVAIIAVCTINAYLKKGIEIALSVVLWISEAFTGFLYIKALEGFLGEFGIMLHLFVLLLLLLMVLFTINHGEKIMQMEGIKEVKEGKHGKEKISKKHKGDVRKK